MGGATAGPAWPGRWQPFHSRRPELSARVLGQAEGRLPGAGGCVQPASIRLGEAACRRCRIGGAAQGAVAQLGERLICNQEVVGSIPISSTSLPPGGEPGRRPEKVEAGPVAQVVRAHP